MRHAQLASRAAAFSLAALFVLVPSASAAVPLDGIQVEVSIEPYPEMADAFLCTARVVDGASGEVISAPKVVFLSGTDARVRSGLVLRGDDGEDVPSTLDLRVSADAGTGTATYVSRILVGDEVRNQQKVTFRLAAEPAAEARRGEAAGYVGEKIDLSVKDADLRDVLRDLAGRSGQPFVIDPEIRGSVTVELRDVPWDRALDQILRINNLGLDRDGGVVAVLPLEKLRP